MIYLDHAATSYPKPAVVLARMRAFAKQGAASPGRSFHRLSVESSRMVFEARETMARLIGAHDSREVIFTSGATESVNLALRSWLRTGDHVITTRMEHNAVMRPLSHLALEKKLTVTLLPQSPDGALDPGDLKKLLRKKTRLVVLNHASNVTGALCPVEELASAAGSVPVLVDAAQTAGLVPIDVGASGIAMLALSGHKGLMGPPGTGILYMREDVAAEAAPVKFGGTGSRSEHHWQPDFMPDKFEAGTPNTYGIAGLAAAVELVMRRGVARIRRAHARLHMRLVSGLESLEGVDLQLPCSLDRSVPNVSFTFRRISSSEAAIILDRKYGICCRAGLHCCPSAHRLMGTFPEGTVRFSPGHGTTAGDIDRAVQAVGRIVRRP